MNFPANTTLARRSLIEQAEDARDEREDWQKLQDAVENHLANIARRDRLWDSVNEGRQRMLELYVEQSRDTLNMVIENDLCVPVDKLQRALSR